MHQILFRTPQTTTTLDLRGLLQKGGRGREGMEGDRIIGKGGREWMEGNAEFHRLLLSNLTTA